MTPSLGRRGSCRSCGSPLSLILGLGLCAPAVAAGPEDPTRHPTPQVLDRVTVIGQRYLPDYTTRDTRGATRTTTRLLDAPQAITIVTDRLIADQAMTSLSDTFRYMPGVGLAQGEGNRDTPVLRGNSSTADFFVDGIRDDVQYFRDTYNLERVEALKGPNAMIFGRGGSGGVINRITREADGVERRDGSLQVGSDARRRGTLDLGTAIGVNAGLRLNAMYENSRSFRDGFRLQRYGANPTVGVDVGANTRLQLSIEHFHDERTADRGIPSFQGRPVDTDPSTFFGDPDLSRTDATADALDATLDHTFSAGVNLRNHLRVAHYDKFYQNVFPGAVDASGTTVTLGAYNHATARTNVFNQSDVTWRLDGGAIDHTLLAGGELGHQGNGGVRMTGYFAPGANVVPVASPTVEVPVEFRPSATDADNRSVATVAAVYVQDQIAVTTHWLAIVGVRFEDFRVRLHDRRSGSTYRSHDTLRSPRAGVVFKPLDRVSLYASWSRAFQPRSGEQLSSLTASNASLAPETFRNRELGAKWDLRPDLAASVAVYRLDRGNVAIVDPADATRMVLVDGQRARGVELGIAGRLSGAWQLMGGYAWQDGQITTTQSATARRGNRLAQLPRHSASLWNRYDFSPAFGLGLGIVHRGAIYANVDNKVTLPGFTRVDAALYWTLRPTVHLQLNVENVGNRRYFASAHSNNNISPGAPRSAWLSLRLGH